MSLKITNGSETLIFGGDVKITSFSESGFEVDNNLNAIIEGFGYNKENAAVGAKKLILKGYVEKNIETNKRLLNRICDPCVGFCKLYDGDYLLECRLLKGIEYSDKKHEKIKLLSFTAEFVCPEPVWYDAVEKSAILYSCTSSSSQSPMQITNTGDREIGFKLQIVMIASSSKIVLSRGTKKLTLEGEFASGGTLFIDTRKGQKGITYQKSSSSSATDAMNFVVPSSDFFTLIRGKNSIGYDFSSGSAHMILTYKQEYFR